MKRFLFAALTAVVVAGGLAGPVPAAGPGCFDYVPKDLLLSSVDHQGAVEAFQVGSSIYHVGWQGAVDKVDISDRNNPVVTGSTILNDVTFVQSAQMRQVSDYLLIFWTGSRPGGANGSFLSVLNLSTLSQLYDFDISTSIEPFHGSDMRLRYIYLAKKDEGLMIYDVRSQNPADWSLVDPGGKFTVGRAVDVAFLGSYAYVVSGNSATVTLVEAANPATPQVYQTYTGSVGDARFVTRMDTKIVLFGSTFAGIYDFFRGAYPEQSIVSIRSAARAYARIGDSYFVLTGQGNGHIYKIDMSSPFALENHGYFTSSSNPPGFMFASGSDLIVSRYLGTDIYDTELFTGTQYLHSQLYIGGEWTSSQGLFVDGDHAYLTLGDESYYTGWLKILDISNRRAPVELANYGFDNQLATNEEFLVASDHLYVTGRYQQGVRVYDVSDKTSPAFVTTVQPELLFTSIRAWATLGHYAYFASHSNGSGSDPTGKIYVLDIGNPSQPAEFFPTDYVYRADENDDLTGIVIDAGQNVLYASTEYGLDVYDINPTTGALTETDRVEFGGNGPLTQVKLADGNLYLATDPMYGNDATYFVDTSQPALEIVAVPGGEFEKIYDLSFDSELYVTSVDDHMSIYIEDEGWPDIHVQRMRYFPATHALTMEARPDFVAYTDGSHFVMAPKLCAEPQTILTGSVTGEGAGEVLDLFHWLFTWKTYGYTDPNLDFVTVTDAVGSPPGCQVGTLELTAATPGVVTSVSYGADGWYTHTFAWNGANCVAGCEYDFTVGSMDETSGGHVLSISSCPRDINIGMGKPRPDVPTLAPASPNPFNPMTTLRYYVPADAQRMALRIYDVKGRLVRQLVEGDAKSGWLESTWDGTDNQGAHVSSGIFFAKFDVDRTTEVQKLIMLK